MPLILPLITVIYIWQIVNSQRAEACTLYYNTNNNDNDNDSKCYYLLMAYYMPGRVLSTLHSLLRSH